MSRVDAKRRKHLIRVKQKRKKKLAQLREEYWKTKSESEKEKVLQKVSKISPGLTKEEFLTPTPPKNS